MIKHKKKISILLLILMITAIAVSVSGCTKGSNDMIESAEQLNQSGYSISVHPGSLASIIAEEKFPNAEIVNQTDISDAYLSVQNGKTDAFVYEKLYMQYAAASDSLKDLSLMAQSIGSTDIAVGINPQRKDLPAKINAFIKQIKSDGTFDDMYSRWVLRAETTMPEIEKPTSPDFVLKVGTSGLIEPMNYYDENQQLTGFDVEFIYRMGVFLNADIQLEAMSFDALVASLESGKLDAVVSDLNVTDERKEVILMSDPYMTSEIGVLVKSERLLGSDSEYTSYRQLNGKKIAILDGSTYDKALSQALPDSEIIGMPNNSDIILALQNGRIDGYVTDEPIAKMQLNSTTGLAYIPDLITHDDYAYVLNKDNTELTKKINTALEELKAEGVVDNLVEKWMNGNTNQEIIPAVGADTSKGILHVMTTNDQEPFCYIQDNKLIGFDIELITRIAEKMGYALDMEVAGFSALIPSVTTGKTDVAIGCITITPERAETVSFTDPVYNGGTVAVVLSNSSAEEGFFAGIASSFKRTFITENRWQLVLNGLLVTIWLSVASAILGTMLGFVVSFPLRSQNRIVNKISGTISKILGGMPLVLLLMILYYIVFKSIDISAVWVGIFGFTLDFANTVAGLLNTGMSAIDKGQIEAAGAMGYNKRQIFTKISFPQAANQMFSQYEGAIVGLVKGTAIIGYITVEDLTKAGDIIRSRTYEAFFPLIATAILYFLIASVLVFVLKKIAVKLDPKHRPRKIRGVKTDD